MDTSLNYIHPVFIPLCNVSNIICLLPLQVSSPLSSLWLLICGPAGGYLVCTGKNISVTDTFYRNLHPVTSDFCLFTLLLFDVFCTYTNGIEAVAELRAYNLSVRLIITILRSPAFPRGRIIPDKASAATHTLTLTPSATAEP